MGTALIGRTVECQVHSLPDGKLKATHVVLKSPLAMGLPLNGLSLVLKGAQEVSEARFFHGFPMDLL